MAIKINEIFYSIQGESSWAGYPTVFVRTSGCHLRCTYCDTTYAYNEGEFLGLDEILAEVQKHKTRYVCVTGGEPLLQKEVHPLMTMLCDQGFHVSLETSGNLSCQAVDRRVKLIIDVKTPDSGEANTFNFENLNFRDRSAEFKFVICSENDFKWSEDFIQQHQLHSSNIVLYSPSFAKIDERWLAQKILSQNSPARLQLQLHKYIWNDRDRGV